MDTKALALSEYGCGGTQDCHSENPSSTTNKGAGGARHDIEYMMWIHEGYLAAIRQMPELVFTSVWVLFDFAMEGRNEGYKLCLDGTTTTTDNSLRRLNDKGLVMRDHVTKKDVFYLYKAEWSSEKFVHICQKSYTKKADRVIKCYSNDGTSFTLKVNGTTVETVTASDNIVLFTAYTFQSGDEITVEGATTSDTYTIA
jgi:beta-galactosidase